MPRPVGRRSVRGPVVVGLSIVTAVLVVAFVATFGIHRATDIRPWRDAFDLARERNVPTWWNTTLLLATAGAAGVVAVLQPAREPARRSWAVVAAAAAALSLDEAAEVHERFTGIGEDLGDAVGWDVPTYAWVLPGSAVAVLLVLALAMVTRPLDGALRRRLAGCLAVYLLAAIGIESLNGWIRRRDHELGYFAGTLVEETLEMAACIAAIGVIGALLRRDVRDDVVVLRLASPVDTGVDGLGDGVGQERQRP